MILAFFFVIFLSSTSPAYAYLDPGSGSLLLYAFASLSGALLYILRGLYYRILGRFIGNGSHVSASLVDRDLVFYSEAGHYWNVFAPIIEDLDKQKVQCAYLTSDKHDEGLLYQSPNVTSQYIGQDAQAAAILNQLKATVVVMTMPQLDIFRVKRSNGVSHYTHVMHGPTDALMYKRYAFDHFDSVLCAGPHQIESIRALETTRGTAHKQLLKTGLTYYDALLKQLPIGHHQEKSESILVAPTWGSNGLLTRHGTLCIRPLLDAGHTVALRPHPQSFISEAEMIAQIEDELHPFENFSIDRSPCCKQAMAASHLLISDLSGIIFDYIFLFSKPVIVIKGNVNRAGLEAEYIKKEIWEISVRELFSTVITEYDFQRLPSIVNTALLNFSSTDMEQLKRESLYNFGKAGEVAANQLITLLRSHEAYKPPYLTNDTGRQA